MSLGRWATGSGSGCAPRGRGDCQRQLNSDPGTEGWVLVDVATTADHCSILLAALDAESYRLKDRETWAAHCGITLGKGVPIPQFSNAYYGWCATSFAT